MEQSTQSVQIRPAAPADAAEVFRLARQLATSAVPEPAAFDRSFELVLLDRHHRLLVADDHNRLRGYLLGLVHPAFHANGYIAWVEELFVDETARGSGLGTRLLTEFEQWAVKTFDATYFALATRRAGDFYRSAGYDESAAYFKKLRRR
jgi:GNAT superfamily N-acetyltransferase